MADKVIHIAEHKPYRYHIERLMSSDSYNRFIRDCDWELVGEYDSREKAITRAEELAHDDRRTYRVVDTRPEEDEDNGF